jgi:hypothetical protein
MRYSTATILIPLLILSAVPAVWGHPDYIGYSGAPGSGGYCAASCHGTGGGTIELSGFPTVYVPEQVYTLTVSHRGGAPISQFNASCRIGNTAENAGQIFAGANTVLYSIFCETNGVHFVTTGLDLGTFDWQAPVPGIGTVKLFISGLQDTAAGGPNSAVVYTAQEGSVSDVDEPEGRQLPELFKSLTNYPNPFNTYTVIEFYYDSDRASNVRLGIYNITGQLIYSRYIYCDKRKTYFSRWNGLNDDGLEVQSGVYFYRLESTFGVNTNKMILMR